ncbi:RNA polymerase sigma factor [Sphingobacterium faecale]|uniref:Sigma-70 family RNA polymerase sigma factor n=1 Tax=Sphingobacterium faecale TaxID=2803775 RepID=A0ABS1R9Z7_9SPHI|nr:sigma-70 family RNA polymerase sigma factor [Sphingobacterium faecale]MBL1411039.1 sigma-70 family RNA polymerase sigma factor [Sphingobacterium faecale]
MTEPGKKINVELLVREQQPKLRSFIRKHVSSAEDAEDILQDVFYQLVKTIDANLSPIEQVSAWLFRVARNMIINKGKKKREVEMPFSEEDEGQVLEEFSNILFGEPSPTPEMVYFRSMVWKELERGLSELPTEQREAFELTEIEGMPVKEVAISLNIPLNTLLSRKHYAVKQLRKKLYGLYKDIMFY